jgi:hypothetical protein
MLTSATAEGRLIEIDDTLPPDSRPQGRLRPRDLRPGDLIALQDPDNVSRFGYVRIRHVSPVREAGRLTQYAVVHEAAFRGRTSFRVRPREVVRVHDRPLALSAAQSEALRELSFGPVRLPARLVSPQVQRQIVALGLAESATSVGCPGGLRLTGAGRRRLRIAQTVGLNATHDPS